jgi:hypothetical protein
LLGLNDEYKDTAGCAMRNPINTLTIMDRNAPCFPRRHDNFTTATQEGIRSAQAAGYRFIRIEGYVSRSLPIDDDTVLNPV